MWLTLKKRASALPAPVFFMFEAVFKANDKAHELYRNFRDEEEADPQRAGGRHPH
ncbi:MAG: hypothetical protein GY862_16590 [Gammaproteobacteria bacterium]|nr:hypothetical protein [Gammaproteobacteria bacterium]